ncbi:MAG TPA: helix-turn-helix transcriptional regulator [Phycisphaerae bacterium]|nr:helix-turn-helix transcriptional regulator [Phycisphaerae bacterium]
MFNGKILRRWRVKREISMAKLAELVGCSANDISRYENQGRLPRPARVKKLADVLGIRENELTNSGDVVRDRLEIVLNEMTEVELAKLLADALELLEKRDKNF